LKGGRQQPLTDLRTPSNYLKIRLILQREIHCVIPSEARNLATLLRRSRISRSARNDNPGRNLVVVMGRHPREGRGPGKPEETGFPPSRIGVNLSGMPIISGCDSPLEGGQGGVISRKHPPQSPFKGGLCRAPLPKLTRMRLRGNDDQRSLWHLEIDFRG
jgi:hypothetical protein